MATQFCFDHVFRAPSMAAVFAAYFDPTQLLLQDQQLDIVERQVQELVDSPDTLRRTCRVVPRRQLPAVVRPFVQGPLHYIETAVWRKHDHEIDVSIWPSLLRRSSQGKPTITALYRLSQRSDGSIHRRYTGTVSVDLALLSGRIERGIVAEFERSAPLAAAATQAFLDGSGSYVSAIA
jgi:hypothetical protein